MPFNFHSYYLLYIYIAVLCGIMTKKKKKMMYHSRKNAGRLYCVSDLVMYCVSDLVMYQIWLCVRHGCVSDMVMYQT